MTAGCYRGCERRTCAESRSSINLTKYSSRRTIPLVNLHLIDALIIGAYLTATIAIGFWISKRASRSIQNYFLGGRQIPWYVLGVSDASRMFDISGTMWMVYLLF